MKTTATSRSKFLKAGAAMLAGAFLVAAQPAYAENTTPGKTSERVETKTGIHNIQDLTTHPLAGMTVRIRVIVRDGLNQAGRSEYVTIKLPQRKYFNALTVILSDIRRNLALDSNSAPDAIKKIDAILAQQATKVEDKTIIDALRRAKENLESKDVQVLDQVVRDLWEIMMKLEAEAFNKIEREFLETERKLREAFERRAPQKEVDKLAERAQKALQKMLQKEQEKHRNDPQAKSQLQQMQEQLRKIEREMKKLDDPQRRAMQKRLSEMMRKMREMMQKNKSQQAQQKNSQKQTQQQQRMSQQQMRQQMKQSIQQMQQRMEQMRKAMQAMKDLQKIIKDQQKVMDDTIAEKRKQQEKLRPIQEQLERLQQSLQGRVTRQQQNSAHPKDIQKRLGEMRSILSGIGAQIRDIKGSGQPVTQKQADELLQKMGVIHKDLQKIEPKPKPKPGQPQQKPSQGQRQLDQIRQQMEQAKKPTAQSRQLEQQQQQLQQRLRELQRKIRQMGLDPKALDKPQKPMGDAKGDLSQGRPGSAVPNQNKALEALRKAQQNLRRQMQQQQQQQQGGSSRRPGGNRGQAEDPNQGIDGGQDQKIGVNPNDVKNRTREIRDQIRKRLQDPNIPDAERKYLERLLKQQQAPKKINVTPAR